MGRLVVHQVLEASDLTLVVAAASPTSDALGVDAGVLAGHREAGVPITPVDAGFSNARVVVDFALPKGTLSALPHLGARALVTGTTGLDADQQSLLDAHAANGPLLHASNFSTGVNVLLALVALAARTLPDFDLEIVEAHHTRKVDAPSGTALALARAGADSRGVSLDAVRRDGRVGQTGPRPPGEIGLHAIRAGSITGHHEVWFGGASEHLVLTHTAGSRDLFATGALRAARWIADQPAGTYSMADVLGLAG
jgi:4-hydroxy-tetrahydrodipicolinate reductase